MKGWASVDTQNGVTGMTSVWGAGVKVPESGLWKVAEMGGCLLYSFGLASCSPQKSQGSLAMEPLSKVFTSLGHGGQ